MTVFVWYIYYQIPNIPCIRSQDMENSVPRSLNELKPCAGRLVVEWVTISESLLLNVFDLCKEFLRAQLYLSVTAFCLRRKSRGRRGGEHSSLNICGDASSGCRTTAAAVAN